MTIASSIGVPVFDAAAKQLVSAARTWLSRPVAYRATVRQTLADGKRAAKSSAGILTFSWRQPQSKPASHCFFWRFYT